jgi:hypothetical protein
MSYSYNYSVNGAAAAAYIVLVIAFYVLVVIGLWKTFVKAGQPGWAGIVPFYNLYVWVKIAGRPTSWFWIMLVGSLLSWIPIIGWILVIAIWVMSLLLALDNAKNFGHGGGFGVLLWLFPMIMFLVLGFGSSQYRQVANVSVGPTAPMPPPAPLAQTSVPGGPPPSLVQPQPLTPPPSEGSTPPPAPPAAQPGSPSQETPVTPSAQEAPTVPSQDAPTMPSQDAPTMPAQEAPSTPAQEAPSTPTAEAAQPESPQPPPPPPPPAS